MRHFVRRLGLFPLLALDLPLLTCCMQPAPPMLALVSSSGSTQRLTSLRLAALVAAVGLPSIAIRAELNLNSAGVACAQKRPPGLQRRRNERRRFLDTAPQERDAGESRFRVASRTSGPGVATSRPQPFCERPGYAASGTRAQSPAVKMTLSWPAIFTRSAAGSEARLQTALGRERKGRRR